MPDDSVSDFTDLFESVQELRQMNENDKMFLLKTQNLRVFDMK